ncbi:DUF1467 family protein [Oricola nitratireducens]|uniref:DUF1467 family protein n=1 Tax=Oricola nitratireducens TaxID=2775868 RepID=UPI001869318F
MSWVSIIAIFFVIWWLVLFTMLPVGVRSQIENNDITLGTDHGAPVKPALLRKIVLTTLVSLVIFGAFYVVTAVMGYGFDDLPRIVPEYQYHDPKN